MRLTYCEITYCDQIWYIWFQMHSASYVYSENVQLEYFQINIFLLHQLNYFTF